jgi:hypothetical protein
MINKVTELKTRVFYHRNWGEVTFEVKKLDNTKSKEDLIQVVDEFVKSFGFYTLFDKWIKINRDEAEFILKIILSTDLAYGNISEKFSIKNELSNEILDLFTSGEIHYFTNGTYLFQQEKKNNDIGVIFSSWTPITEATFDTGIVCLDQDKIGIIWVQVED